MSQTMAAARDAFGKALVDIGRENPNLVVLDADLAPALAPVEARVA